MTPTMTMTMMMTPTTDDNDTQQTNHDCIGSLACMPNEPKPSAKLRNVAQLVNHVVTVMWSN